MHKYKDQRIRGKKKMDAKLNFNNELEMKIHKYFFVCEEKKKLRTALLT